MSSVPSGEATPQGVRLTIPLHRPYVTYALLAIIAGIFLFQIVYNQANFPDREPLTNWGALEFQSVLKGDYYRLFTSMFLHVNEIHIAFNAIALYYTGRQIEPFFGHFRFGLIYFLGGLLGSILSFMLTRATSVGASGAIFAIFGAEMVFLYRNRGLLGPRARSALQSLVILMVINFGFGILTNVSPSSTLVIDNWGHFGGLIGGLLLTWFIGPEYQISIDATAPMGQRLTDKNALTKTWPVPVAFVVGLVLIMVVSLGNLHSTVR